MLFRSHIVLHLPEHVRRFGPPMLFATEGFESFNAVIRSHSIHSNHRAPSRDIAAGMAQHNRVRHILSGGFFCMPRVLAGQQDEVAADSPHGSADSSPRSPWLQRMRQLSGNGQSLDEIRWRHAGPEPATLLALNSFETSLLGSLQLGHQTEGNRPGRSAIMHTEKCAHSTRNLQVHAVS